MIIQWELKDIKAGVMGTIAEPKKGKDKILLQPKWLKIVYAWGSPFSDSKYYLMAPSYTECEYGTNLPIIFNNVWSGPSTKEAILKYFNEHKVVPFKNGET